MLILTRRPGESIHIGEQITLTVLGMQGQIVRLGIDAPAHVEIWRQEIYEERQKRTRTDTED